MYKILRDRHLKSHTFLKLYYLNWEQHLYFKGSKYIYPKPVIFKAKDSFFFFLKVEFVEQLIFYKIIIKTRLFFGEQTTKHRFVHFLFCCTYSGNNITNNLMCSAPAAKLKCGHEHSRIPAHSRWRRQKTNPLTAL